MGRAAALDWAQASRAQALHGQSYGLPALGRGTDEGDPQLTSVFSKGGRNVRSACCCCCWPALWLQGAQGRAVYCLGVAPNKAGTFFFAYIYNRTPQVGRAAWDLGVHARLGPISHHLLPRRLHRHNTAQKKKTSPLCCPWGGDLNPEQGARSPPPQMLLWCSVSSSWSHLTDTTLGRRWVGHWPLDAQAHGACQQCALAGLGCVATAPSGTLHEA